MSNYSPRTEVDKSGIAKIGYPPARVALASNNRENTGTSSVLLFTHDTTEIQVTPVGLGVAGRWAANSATSVVTGAAAAENFDFIVPAGLTARFVVPQSVSGTYSSVQGVNRAEGLYQGIAYISVTGGNGSVLTSEF